MTARTVPPSGGLLSVEDLEGKIRPDDGHYAQTRLVCLENTHNRGGGRVHPARFDRQNLELGAVERPGDALRRRPPDERGHRPRGIAAREWAKPFDTVSVCFSKGLGAPVGSALIGSGDAIRKAHRLRKVLGGGMRQAGILAAAAIYALDQNVDRLAEDHENARILANAVEETDGLSPRIRRGRVEPRLDRRRSEVGDGGGTRRKAPGAVNFDERARGAGDEGMYSSRRLARRCRDRRRGDPRPVISKRGESGVARRREGTPGTSARASPGPCKPSWRVRSIPRTPLGPYALIAAADVSFDRGADDLYAAVVVVKAGSFEVVETVGVTGPASFPYVPGLLSFREAPGVDRGVPEAQIDARRRPLRRPGHRPSEAARHRQPPRTVARHPDGRMRQESPLWSLRRARTRSGRSEPDAGQGWRNHRRGFEVAISGQAAFRLAGAPVRRRRRRAARDGDDGGRLRLPEPARMAHDEVNRLRRSAKEKGKYVSVTTGSPGSRRSGSPPGRG